jgi:hypothetical protein
MIITLDNSTIWPGGPLGSMVKPMAWRKWNDCVSFLRDYDQVQQNWKRWKRPIHAYQNLLWEREKDGLRKWWYALSERERSYWLGRRADGEIKNILQATGFKSRRYQTGNFTMFPAGTMTLNKYTLELSASNNTAANLDFSPPAPLYATFELQRDGDHARDDSGDTSNGRNPQLINTSGDWVTPRSSTVGDRFEAKWNWLSGSSAVAIDDENYTEDTWTTINTTLRVGKGWQSTAVSDEFEIDIGDDGSSNSDVNRNYFVEAGDIL